MKNFFQKIYFIEKWILSDTTLCIYIFLLLFGGFSFVFAGNINEEQQVLEVVNTVSQLFGHHLNVITIILTITAAGLTFVGWNTGKNIEKTYDEKIAKSVEAKEDKIREMVKEHSTEMEILKKKILFLKSEESDDIKNQVEKARKFLKSRNFHGPDVKNVNDFKDKDINELWDRKQELANGVVVFFPQNENDKKIGIILNILGEKKLEQDIPLIIYWSGIYGKKLKEHQEKFDNYVFRNFANTDFTLAMSIYNMLAIVNLEKYRNKQNE